MNNCFSPELIQETIAYFHDEYGHEISNDEAINYLHSLAELYLAFTQSVKRQWKGRAIGRTPQAAPNRDL